MYATDQFCDLAYHVSYLTYTLAYLIYEKTYPNQDVLSRAVDFDYIALVLVPPWGE